MAKTNAEKCKEYRDKNKDKRKEYEKQYYQKNKKSIILKSSIWVENNRDLSKQYKRKYKYKNKVAGRELVQLYKSQNPCSCGESHHRCLDFHHINPDTKKMCVTRMVAEGYSLKMIQTEIDKCKLICSNCHRKYHSKNTITRNDKGRYVHEIKSNQACSRCGENDDRCLDFHHLRDKDTTVSQIVGDKNYTLQDLKNEIDKCIILCSNCHRKEHAQDEELNTNEESV